MIGVLKEPLPRLLAIAIALVAVLALFAIEQASAQDNAPPAIASATIYQNTLDVFYDRDLDESQVPPLSAYVVVSTAILRT